jgi:quercetin dioxygenase-like cupin family protein
MLVHERYRHGEQYAQDETLHGSQEDSLTERKEIMELQTLAHEIFYPDTREKALFTPEGPRPQFLVDGQHFKVIVAGLEPGQQIPNHPESFAVYHFLEGKGVMFVDTQQFAVAPGATVITPAGANRGMHAETRLIFMAVKSN